MEKWAHLILESQYPMVQKKRMFSHFLLKNSEKGIGNQIQRLIKMAD